MSRRPEAHPLAGHCRVRDFLPIGIEQFVDVYKEAGRRGLAGQGMKTHALV